MKPLQPILTTAFADLVDDVHSAAFDERFPANGSFHKLKRGRRSYWYHVMRDETSPSGRRSTYAGAVGDPAVDALVDSHGRANSRHKVQKQNASMLRRGGLASPSDIEGRLAEAFQKAGLFQAGAVMVGSVAYQSYGGILGARLENELHRTQDIDLAQDREIAVHVEHTGQRIEDFQKILSKVDPTFEPKFNPAHPTSGPTRYENVQKYKVDLLTSHRNSDRDRTVPVRLDILPGAALQPLDLMEFLIKNPVRSALLHGAGVAVVVPDPARYAIHKTTISQMRSLSGEATKGQKDVAQAAELLRALDHAGKASDVAQAWSEVWDPKSKRRQFLARGALSLPDDALAIVAKACGRFGERPFDDGQDPAGALRPHARSGNATSAARPGARTARKAGGIAD